jgi:hypothetical protein
MEPDQWGDAGGKAAQRLTDAQRIRKRSAVPMGGAMDDNGKSFTVRNEDDCGAISNKISPLPVPYRY